MFITTDDKSEKYLEGFAEFSHFAHLEVYLPLHSTWFLLITIDLDQRYSLTFVIDLKAELRRKYYDSGCYAEFTRLVCPD